MADNTPNFRSCRNLSDEQFLTQCRFEAFRGSGPGGLKRNKTSSAIRLIHIRSGQTATGEEYRSQSQNRAAALKRLRHRMAMKYREPMPKDIPELDFDISNRNEKYLPLLGLVLDVLTEMGWSVSDASNRLGISTGQLVKFLRRDEKLWEEVNRQRQRLGLTTLRG